MNELRFHWEAEKLWSYSHSYTHPHFGLTLIVHFNEQFFLQQRMFIGNEHLISCNSYLYFWLSAPHFFKGQDLQKYLLLLFGENFHVKIHQVETKTEY